jgi:hypothetical protein
MVQTNPRLLRRTVKAGLLPRHHAARRDASWEVDQLFVELYEPAVTRKSAATWLPLHYAVARKASADMVPFVTGTCGGPALREGNGTGWQPLRPAAHHNVSLDVVQVLADTAPTSCKEKVEDGSRPLYLADLSRQVSLPASVGFGDGDGDSNSDRLGRCARCRRRETLGLVLQPILRRWVWYRDERRGSDGLSPRPRASRKDASSGRGGARRIGRAGAGRWEDTGWARPFSLPPSWPPCARRGTRREHARRHGPTVLPAARFRGEWGCSSRVAIRASVREPPWLVRKRNDGARFVPRCASSTAGSKKVGVAAGWKLAGGS